MSTDSPAAVAAIRMKNRGALAVSVVQANRPTIDGDGNYVATFAGASPGITGLGRHASWQSCIDHCPYDGPCRFVGLGCPCRTGAVDAPRFHRDAGQDEARRVGDRARQHAVPGAGRVLRPVWSPRPGDLRRDQGRDQQERDGHGGAGSRSHPCCCGPVHWAHCSWRIRPLPGCLREGARSYAKVHHVLSRRPRGLLPTPNVASPPPSSLHCPPVAERRPSRAAPLKVRRPPKRWEPRAAAARRASVWSIRFGGSREKALDSLERIGPSAGFTSDYRPQGWRMAQSRSCRRISPCTFLNDFGAMMSRSWAGRREPPFRPCVRCLSGSTCSSWRPGQAPRILSVERGPASWLARKNFPHGQPRRSPGGP